MDSPQPESHSTGPYTREEKLNPIKLHLAQYYVALILAVLVIGLWRLQIVGADGYRVLAEANRTRKVPVLAPRGRLFDREGRLLVDNYPSVTCYLLREQVKDFTPDLPLIAQGLHIPVDQIQATLRRFQTAPKYQPIPLKQDITPDEQAFIAAHRDELPELETLDEQRRLYPRDGFAAHLIGYVGEISENDLNQAKYDLYSPGDVVGKSGVEETYDALLRGKDGSRDVIVNSHGKEIGQLGQELAVPGQDLKLTIDLDIQMAAEKALEGKTGAIVAMDPHTGEILALASRPTFDPNQFAVRLTKSYWSEIVNNPDHPLLNKAIQAQLAPGSTFKIIMSLAGLQEGVAQTMHVICNGGATFYGHFFACDKHHGMVDINNAIPWSCDTFYYTLANRLGIDTIAKYATAVGLSQKTGIDLPDEATGTMPSTAWKLKTQHEKWYAGEVISVGIGQGATTVTPAATRPRSRRHRLRRSPPPPPRRLPRRDPARGAPGRSRKTSPAPATRPSPSPPPTGRPSPTPWPPPPPPAPPPPSTSKASTSPARPAPPRSSATSAGAASPARRPSAPTPGSLAWPPAATPTSSSPCSSSMAAGAPKLPRHSPPRSSTPSSKSSASATTTSASPTPRPQPSPSPPTPHPSHPKPQAPSSHE